MPELNFFKHKIARVSVLVIDADSHLGGEEENVYNLHGKYVKDDAALRHSYLATACMES